MKNSGIEWIGDIPDDWEVKRLKDVAISMNSGGTPNSSDESFYSDNGTPWVIIADMKTDFVFDTQKKLSEKGLKDKKLHVYPQGTILYAMYASVGKVSELKIDAAVNQAILAIIVDKCSTNNSFLKYSLKAYEQFVAAESNGNTQYNLNAYKVSNFSFAFCSLSMQEIIAGFLDKQCAAVDRLIENQSKQIEKLNKYKQSVIAEAVTKGLSPSVPMKESGIEWIGKVPMHWKICRVKNVFSLRNERNFKELSEVNLISLYTDKGVVQHSDLIETTGNRAVNADGYKIVKKDDIVVNIILCWMGAIGKSEYDGVTSPAYDVYKPNKSVCVQYYHYLFRTKNFNAECYRYGRGIMMMRWRTYSTEFSAIGIPFPSIEEQREIANYLDKKCKKIDKLIAIKQQKIEKLNEYKKSLIYEYVTGKKEVN